MSKLDRAHLDREPDGHLGFIGDNPLKDPEDLPNLSHVRLIARAAHGVLLELTTHD